jgi:hypothetical protein
LLTDAEAWCFEENRVIAWSNVMEIKMSVRLHLCGARPAIVDFEATRIKQKSKFSGLRRFIHAFDLSDIAASLSNRKRISALLKSCP